MTVNGRGGTRGGFAALDACVHCGFCLQACPTFLATGDEADGPRGRIELMRALERGELGPDDPELGWHLDRCLGCRGCEPVCPSGVGYGEGLEAAREQLTRQRGVPRLARMALALMTSPPLSTAFYAGARALRATGLPRAFSGRNRMRWSLGMLAATKADGRIAGWADGRSVDDSARSVRSADPPIRQSVRLFRGCVMDGLFSHVHEATIRTLTVNGYEVHEVPGQGCCGALHAHAGIGESAAALARNNVQAFGDEPGSIVVNSAGCGAQLKAYGHVLGGEPAAERFASRVRDVTELLAEHGPVPGAPPLGRPLRVAYDAPCHLAHAQRVIDPPLAVLRAIPGLDLSQTADSAQCCGGAGLYTVLEPGLSREVLAPKLAALLHSLPDVVATGNPGCVMQIGGGLLAARAPVTVRHPVELLDASYRAAGFYT